MIRFFRTLRQRLLAENRVSRYLLYAIGEIVLVVIGILLALQINTWNQERENRAEERKYLIRLEQDLKRDLELLESVRANYERRLVLAVRILDSIPGSNAAYVRESPWFQGAWDHYLQHEVVEKQSRGEDLRSILVIAHFAPTETTMEELLSSGKINLLSNDSLKIKLQYHYPSLNELARFQDVIVMEVQKNYRNTLLGLNISLYDHTNLERIFDSPSLREQLELALENYLVLTNSMLGSLVYEPDSVFKRTTLLLQGVQEHLNLLQL